QAPLLGFVQRYGELFDDERARAVARDWLTALMRGGIYDQVGGGLFRYSTDESWLVPHFEKMLYDNGLLLSSLADAYRAGPSDEIARTVRQTAAFLARDLDAGEGAYYSSLDAETSGVEGATYTWTWGELGDALTDAELELASRHLGASERGNWHSKSILTRLDGRGEAADDVDRVLEKLLAARMERPQPKVVTNLLTEWNAIAARGLIEAGDAIGDRGIVDQGLRTVEWLLTHVFAEERVLHVPGGEPANSIELIADYAATAAAFTAAAQVRGDSDLRDEAARLLDRALDVFATDSILHMTSEKTDLPLRPIAYDDAPTPSGAATLAEVVATLRPGDTDTLDRLLAPATGIARRAPFMAGTWLRVMTGRVEAAR
ncbi:MAG: thioredoxin domain-containing protein, partial [Coriobacteriales bacterium]|nr:thioredoxin domain-containing protein [Coriobacteriales bacterium]